MHSANTLCRTPIDLLIHERLNHLQSKASFKNLALMADKPMAAYLPDGRQFVSGEMDYVIGYGLSKSFTCASIEVEQGKCAAARALHT